MGYKFIFIFVVALSASLSAQSTVDRLRLATTSLKIPIQSLLGFWNPLDSMHSKIEFINNYYLMIKENNQLTGYMFNIENDSVYVNGVKANWPPLDCILNLKSPTLLEINYFQYFDKEPYVLTYRRK